MNHLKYLFFASEKFGSFFLKKKKEKNERLMKDKTIRDTKTLFEQE